MERVHLNSLAEKKMLFHSIKYSKNDTIGILTGYTDSDGLCRIDNAYPVSHLRVTLPLIENALLLIEG